MENNSRDLSCNKPKSSYLYVFGCKVYMFLPNKIHVNKLALYSEFDDIH